MSLERTNTITISTPAPVQSSQTFNQQLLAQLQQQALAKHPVRVIASQVWVFYPTPPTLVAQMLSLAQLQPCFELSPLLRCGLQLQGFN